MIFPQMTTLFQGNVMQVQREISSKPLATIMSSVPEDELKHRVLTEGGLTIAEDERLNRIADNPQTTTTLSTSQEVMAHFSSLISPTKDAD